MTPTIPKIILDTDPGGDDAFALLWLLSMVKKGLAELLAVTTVDGNVGPEITFVGACKLLRLTGFSQIKVARGVIGGSQFNETDAAFLHGVDGMGNLTNTLEPCHLDYEAADYGDDVIISTLSQYPHEVTIIAIGPLTNLAAAERKSPGILKKAKEIIIMGGAFCVPGNVTPEAEFNIVYDVEAAKTVFSSRDDLIVIPLDITCNLIFTPAMAIAICKSHAQTPLGKFILSLVDFMTENSLAWRETGSQTGFLVHDAATLAYLYYPENLKFRRGYITVETGGEFTKGKTLLDNRRKTKIGANAWIAIEVDAVNLQGAMSEDLKFLISNLSFPNH
ncbi:MAG: Pyrimidine-specific ribonucleoside hydrolase RihB [Chroococcopsis gigantea SAG 12.99]|jgi:inosine-uridine nucleoside N-ribohydrolase|nr:nucleoside hydrolase [Chlorogloea purpurea SAG 13.99]MDV3001918.1 Pyrimidine-specific ribonucleoside hydrolase RihB [Chroococcopsis gigantea SAG 12.99]